MESKMVYCPDIKGQINVKCCEKCEDRERCGCGEEDG